MGGGVLLADLPEEQHELAAAYVEVHALDADGDVVVDGGEAADVATCP